MSSSIASEPDAGQSTGDRGRYNRHVEADPTEASDLSRLLSRAGAGDDQAASALLPLVYEQLRRIAEVRMRGERRDHTLQPTALVHEAYARLVGAGEVAWRGRGHFFVAAAEAMRRILVEHARARGRLKRAGGRARLKLDMGTVADLAGDDKAEEIIALDAALRRLQEQRPRVAQVVQLRFFAGLTVDETAAALGVSPRTVDLDWAFARAWLYDRLAGEPGTQEQGDG